jgi:hypothetical protein
MSQGWTGPTFTGIRSGDQIKLDGWSSLTVEQSFSTVLATTDKRRSKTFVLSYQGVNNPDRTYTYPESIAIPNYNKYIDRTDVGNGTADYALNHYITRFSDLLLMHSEAENELNGPTENALYGINRVRARAGLLLKAQINQGNLGKPFSRRGYGNYARKVMCGLIETMNLMTTRIKKYK